MQLKKQKMKKYIVILTLICVSTINAQSLADLMNGYENKFAFEHSKLVVNAKYSQAFQESLPHPIHESIRIIGVDNVWLQKITDLVKPNPSLLFPYLESDTHNLSAYILLSHIFNIKIRSNDDEDNIEDIYLSNLKIDVFSQESLNEYISANSIPTGVDVSVYMLNTVWKYISPQANARIKALLP